VTKDIPYNLALPLCMGKKMWLRGKNLYLNGDELECFLFFA